MSMALLGPSGRLTLEAPVYTLGSEPGNQVVLHDPKVSPRHAVLQLQGQQYSITDLGSVDGTYLNEQQLAPQMPVFLKNGDRLRIGDTFYTVEESLPAAPAYAPTMVASSSPNYDATVQATPAYGQVPQTPVAPAYGQVPAAPAYGQVPGVPVSGQSSPSYPAYPAPAPADPYAAPVAAYAPAPGQPYPPQQPWAAGMPPGYIPPAAPVKKKKGLMIAIILLIVVLLGGSGIGYYVATRPKPVIAVTSDYSVGTMPAGANSTVFHLNGDHFTANSAIMFLLDGSPVPGSQPVQSDSNGKVITALTVTNDWSVGTHKITAKDAAGYITALASSITIVAPGVDKTPGPNGAPTDTADMTIDATVQASSSNSSALTMHLKVIGGIESGTVCRDIDTGQPRTINDTTSQGEAFTETITTTCSGTYKSGRLSYTETVTADKIVFNSGVAKGVTCTAQTPYVAYQLDGSFTNGTDINGKATGDAINVTCRLGSASKSTNEPAQSGTWTGVAAVR